MDHGPHGPRLVETTIVLNALPLGERLALRKPKTDRLGHIIEDGEDGPGIVSIEEA